MEEQLKLNTVMLEKLDAMREVLLRNVESN